MNLSNINNLVELFFKQFENQKDKKWDSSKIIKSTSKNTKEGIIERSNSYWKNAKDINDYQPRKILENDNDRLASYYIYTFMPFGRMVKDVSPFADNNLWDNPSRLPEKLIGFPLQSISREKKKLEKGVYKASSIMGN